MVAVLIIVGAAIAVLLASFVGFSRALKQPRVIGLFVRVKSEGRETRKRAAIIHFPVRTAGEQTVQDIEPHSVNEFVYEMKKSIIEANSERSFGIHHELK